MPKKKKPVIRDNRVFPGETGLDRGGHIELGSPEWLAWLDSPDHPGFIYESEVGHFSARREIRRGNHYWYAFRRRDGKLSKIYLGKAENITNEVLREAAERLSGKVSMSLLLSSANDPDRSSLDKPPENQTIPQAGGSVGFPPVPLAKVKLPVLPKNLISRSRLTSRITTPVTLISAPAGYGKSTLLNEWRLSSGIQVAWIGLDEGDNDPYRFWSAMVAAFQSVNSDFGQILLAMIRTSSTTSLSQIVIELTNEIIRFSGGSSSGQEIGIVLDNFQHIHNPEILSSLSIFIDHLPSNLKLVIACRKKTDLDLGKLRAKGRVVELGVEDLRFNVEEGVDYLWQNTLEKHLPYRDMETLVSRSDGWITGLVLAVNAVSQQKTASQFAATFTGAHPYLQEYFQKNILVHQPPEIREFLLKTSVLRQLSGPLCDALIGRKGSEEILSELSRDDLFLERIDSEHFPEMEWFVFHDLFKEMLRTELYKEQPFEVQRLYKKAADWFLSNNAPADSIYYLLVSEEWLEAASAIEKVALRELRRFGGGARVYRWLQQLPEAIYPDHSQLLGLYIRLARLVTSESAVEDLISRISSKIEVAAQDDRSESMQDTIHEIKRIGEVVEAEIVPSFGLQLDDEYGSAVKILNGIQSYRKVLREDVIEAERMASIVYEAAREKDHLLGILMAGGTCANLALSQSQLRRSERIAHQVLEQAYGISGDLPEAASIPLTALSRVFYERNQLIQAHQLLVRASEVDPQPASMNEPVTIALLRAKIQSAQGDYDAAIMTIQAVLELFDNRPSNIWMRQDLISYQALFLLRQGNLVAAERKISEGGEIDIRPFSALTRAAILIEQERYVAAEEMISGLLDRHPAGYYWLPTIRARVMLATVLFKQHKINQARQVMAETANLAGPEFFVRPFFVSGTEIVSLLSLVLHTENLSPGIKSFLRGTLTMLGHADGVQEILPREEAEALRAAASITPREQEVLNLLCANLSNKEIAEQCSISPSTVKTHLENIYRKLGVNSRAEATAHARMLNLV